MKKTIFGIVFLLSLLFAVNVCAEDVSVNGRDIKFSRDTGIPYVNSDYRTMVPVRIITENLGASVAWSEPEEKVTVTTDSHTVEIFVGKDFIIVDGVSKQMDTVAIEQGGRTYLPIRYVAEAIDCHVMWFDYKEKAVIMDADYYGKYTAFRDMFSYDGVLSDYTEVVVVSAVAQGKMSLEEMTAYWNGMEKEDKKFFITMATMEKHDKNPQYPISIAYIFKDTDGKQYYLATASTFSYDVQLFSPFEK